MTYFTLFIREFDEHAAQIIDKCFSQDENLALNILTTKSELYFDYTPIELAEEAGCRAFLASRCVQTHADQLWFGHISESIHKKTIANILVSDA
ncbi:unnamed protein product [Rotaria sordida]|uniref:TRPM-like domain-containing protein n=1 Tax=Rotaria sordida TaxID=392033 RepID=A0A818RGE6_9BILA|nr:unnamed protein product [Rotaria sordida]